MELYKTHMFEIYVTEWNGGTFEVKVDATEERFIAEILPLDEKANELIDSDELRIEINKLLEKIEE